MNDGKTSLNGYYQSMLWVAILFKFYTIVSDQDLIQISRSRIERYNLILKMLKLFLIGGSIVLFIENFLIMNIILETFYLIILFGICFQIYRIVKTERENIKSKINKIRLNYLLDLWRYFLIYFFAVIIEYGMMDALFPDGKINGLYFTVVAFFMNLSPIMIALSVYWSVFFPKKTRKNYDLSNPKTFDK